MEGFVFPNEAEVQWDLLIVIYPFITGLVAGAFIVSSLYHVFGMTSLKPVARFSLLAALAFLLITPLPLVLHLGKIERGIEMFLRPNVTSAMAMFGYIWFSYLLLMLMEVWLVFRKDIVGYARTSKGALKMFYKALTLGVDDISEKSLEADHKLIKILAAAGIPIACLLHGYVGFIFGAIKANPWWSTPLMPLIFLMSAIVSGIALLIVMYILVSKIRRAPIDHACVKSMLTWLFGFLIIDITIEGLEIISLMYEAEESWEILSELLTKQIWISFFVIQIGIGAVVPLLLISMSRAAQLRDQAISAIGFVAAGLVLIGIFAMRWNVVIGGQLVSKSFRGFTEFTPPLTGLEGVGTAVGVLLLPLIVFSVFVYLVPPWKEYVEPAKQPVGIRSHSFGQSFRSIQKEA